jgi:hypothetical protein
MALAGERDGGSRVGDLAAASMDALPDEATFLDVARAVQTGVVPRLTADSQAHRDVGLRVKYQPPVFLLGGRFAGPAPKLARIRRGDIMMGETGQILAIGGHEYGRTPIVTRQLVGGINTVADDLAQVVATYVRRHEHLGFGFPLMRVVLEPAQCRWQMLDRELVDVTAQWADT